MKRFFTLCALVAAAIFLSPDTAQAQLRIGANGIEFDDDYDSKQTVSARPVISYKHDKVKSKFSIRIGRPSKSSIPSYELGWNVLSNVGYAPYEGTPYGEFFDIRNWKSTQFTVNLFGASAYSHSAKVGLSMGIGIRANNYRLDSSMTLAKQNGVIVPQAIADLSTRGVKKSKFNIASVHIPMEVVFGNTRRFAFSMGGYVDMVMNSHTKIKYRGGSKDKVHNFPTNFIQAGAVARFTFYGFSIFCAYQPTQLFKTGRGPEAQQWTIGIGF